MKANKRLIFFNKGVQAFRNYSKTTTDRYHCPICGVSFSNEDLNNKLLSLEHVPPKSQRGKGIALTCSQCNNTAGHTIDAEVANREHNFKLVTLVTQGGEYYGDVELTFERHPSQRFNCLLTAKNNNINIFIKPKSNNPNAGNNLERIFFEHNENQPESVTQLTISTRKKYNPRLANIGYLKSAFLVAFASYGYSYAFDRNLNQVREQIIHHDKDILNNYTFRLRDQLPDNNMFIYATSPVHALIVVFRDTGVILPLPSFFTTQYVYNLLPHNITSQPVEFKGSTLAWPKSLLLGFDLKTRPHPNKIAIKTDRLIS